MKLHPQENDFDVVQVHVPASVPDIVGDQLLQPTFGTTMDLGASSTISIEGMSSPVAAPSSLNFLADGSTRSSSEPMVLLKASTDRSRPMPIAPKCPTNVPIRSYSCFPNSLISFAFRAML